MNRLCIVVLVAALGCDLGATNVGTLDETESGSMSGGSPVTSGTTDATLEPTTETTSGQGSSSGSPATSTTDGSLESSTSFSTSSGAESSEGEGESSSTGDSERVMCELDGCWSECSVEFDARPPFEGEIPCHGASQGWTAPPCEAAATLLCPQIDPFSLSPAELTEAATCFLGAVQGDVPGLLSYSVGAEDVSETIVYVNGDGTVLLDMRASEHCGNGGIVGTRFIMTRNLDVVDEASEGFQTCVASEDPDVLTACVLGEGNGGVFNPDALPWLAGSCSAQAPMCSF